MSTLDLFPWLAQKRPGDPDPFALNLQSGLMVAAAVNAVAQLGIADHLQEQPKTVAQLAQETNTHSPTLLLLLRALASIGIFTECPDGTFIHTDRSRLLCSHVAGSQVDLIRLWGADYQWWCWSYLASTVVTGRPAIEVLAGQGATIWTHLDAYPDEREIFQRGLAVNAALLLPALFASYDFSRFLHMIDVGGGQGVLTSSLLQRYPTLHATLFDLPAVVEQVQRGPALELPPEVACRYMQVTGNFFEQIPPGGDLYLLKNVLMDWGDEQCQTILTNCHQAMHLVGRLLIIEPVIGEQTSFTRFFSLQMAMLMHAAHHRTLEEHERLLQASGFTLIQTIPLGLEYQLLEVQPVALPTERVLAS